MVSRREVLQAGIGLPVATALKSTEIGDRAESNRPRLVTGVAAMDVVTGGIAVGGLTCLLGRPSMGKTSLALQVALSVCVRHKCNVMFSSAREPARRVAAQIQRAGADVVVVGDVEHQEWAIYRSRSHAPAVYVLNVGDGQADAAYSLISEMVRHGVNGCGLWVQDGWSCYPTEQMPRSMRWGGVQGYCHPGSYYRPVVLSEAAIPMMRARAQEFAVPVIAGIQTAEKDIGATSREPTSKDLLHLERSVMDLSDRTVWLYRPMVYDKDFGGDPWAVEVTGRRRSGAVTRATYQLTVPKV